MIPFIESEIVDKQRWIKKEDFLDLIALAQTVPGIFAVNIAIFIGYKLRKFKGALAMTLGTILPSFLIILAIALFFRQYQHLETVERIFKGIRPAVVALIAAPCFKMARTARISRYNIWIPVVSALLIWLLGFSPIYIIILAGLGGYLYGRYKQHQTRQLLQGDQSNSPTQSDNQPTANQPTDSHPTENNSTENNSTENCPTGNHLTDNTQKGGKAS